MSYSQTILTLTTQTAKQHIKTQSIAQSYNISKTQVQTQVTSIGSSKFNAQESNDDKRRWNASNNNLKSPDSSDVFQV